MNRRQFLALLGGVSIGGCTDLADEGNETPHSRTGTPTKRGILIIEETVNADTKFDEPFEAGAVLKMFVSVHEGGPAVIKISTEVGSEVLFEETVENRTTLTYEVEHDGIHYIQVDTPTGSVVEFEVALVPE